MLARALADPASVLELDNGGWTVLLCTAHAERLAATLAHRVEGLAIPESAARVLTNARLNAVAGRVRALWEVEMMRRALAPLDVPVVLLKGCAFLAAGLEAGQGRLVGDLDILVPRDRLDAVEAAVLGAGWEWLKTDAYDDHYYRTWMHELPPLIHRDRDAMIDVHHTILPLTARPKPDAGALISASMVLENGVRILCPEDMIVHAAAHLLADGDMSGGLRNLWDIHCLISDVADDRDFWSRLAQRAHMHGLETATDRAVRLSAALFGTAIPNDRDRWNRQDRWYVARLTARDGWGRETHKLLRFIFYVRSHLIRMPLPMLLRHLFTKWRKARGSK
jgi:Uncharacterised nucleotidyltransferase